MYKISVIVPSYNSAHYLPDCLDSLVSQTMRDFEVIIVDDASDDDTEGIVKQYTDIFQDRIKYIKLEKRAGRGGLGTTAWLPRKENISHFWMQMMLIAQIKLKYRRDFLMRIRDLGG